MDVRNKRSKIGLTYIGAVIMTLILYRGIPALGKSVAPFVCEFLGIDASVTVLTCVVVVTALVLLIYRLLLRKVHFKGVLSITGAGAGEAFRMALLAFGIFAICIIAIAFFDYGGIVNMVAPSALTILLSVCAGLYEETAFRALPISILMKNRPTDRRIVLSVIITSLIFGAVHMTNVGAGENVGIALYQSFQAMIIGAMLAAFYLRSGSIVLSMAFHFMHDVVSMMLPTQSTGAMLQQTVSLATLIPDIVIMASEIVITIYLLRPSVMEEIRKTWSAKWSEE